MRTEKSDMVSLINQDAHHYWRLSGYTADDVNKLLTDIDAESMVARVTFLGPGVEFATTRRTLERQEGRHHYSAIVRFFNDLSLHPKLKSVKGTIVVWLEDGLWEWQQKHTVRAPILSFGRHRNDLRSFLIPDPIFLDSRGYVEDKAYLARMHKLLPWESRKQGVFWRGAATGVYIGTEHWRKTARGRLVMLAREMNDPTILDAKITKNAHLNQDRQREMAEEGVTGSQVEFREFLKYKYLIDADGYCCAWKSLALKTLSGSAVLKIHSDYEQWFYRELKPWVNFVPIRPDLADFSDVYRWLLSHDDHARSIAEAGKSLMGNWNYERALEETADLCSAILLCQKGNEVYS